MGSQTVADDFPYINAVISMASPKEIDLERRKRQNQIWKSICLTYFNMFQVPCSF